jgi:aminopeptidase
MSYTLPADVLEKYAKVLANFALNSGKGVKAGEVVWLQAPLSALPLYRALKRRLIDSGAIALGQLTDDMSGENRYFYERASQTQLTKFLDKIYKGYVAQIDHRIGILADYDLRELEGIDPKKLFLVQKTNKPAFDWFQAKEKAGKYTWTLALYGTPAMAKEAGLTEKSYWQQIIKACYLDQKDPIKKWQQTAKEIERVSRRLNALDTNEVRLAGKDCDLKVKIGSNRRWLGGSGRNIPSYEIFTSPDWRGTEGWIRFNQPLFRYGQVVEGVELWFEKGRVVKARAKKNRGFLDELLATDQGATKVGEFSLTDRRLSRITKFMAETLFDENRGGRYGNTHLALGSAYPDAYYGKAKTPSKKELARIGFNDSAVHVDIVSTSDRTVTAKLADGRQKIIYQDGQFTV